mmetsp:Transcript_24522/g.78848  ORF Transcript_24522/g.78848 Transcript_24522/m.78848 type:complete len:148 (+) Transcript_24522:761-1204(+)
MYGPVPTSLVQSVVLGKIYPFHQMGRLPDPPPPPPLPPPLPPPSRLAGGGAAPPHERPSPLEEHFYPHSPTARQPAAPPEPPPEPRLRDLGGDSIGGRVEALLPALREGVARVDASSEEGRAIRAALADVEATLAKLRQQQEQQGQQ